GQADQLPWGHVQPGPLQPLDRVVHEVAGAGRQHHSSSSAGVTLPRRMSQATPRRSLIPTRARFRLLYLETPVARWRWFTGTLTERCAGGCIGAGRYRGRWSKYGRSRKASRSNSLMPRPVSGVASRGIRERIALASLDAMRLLPVSLRSTRQPANSLTS